MIALPVGSALLLAAWLLIAGGHTRLAPRVRRTVVVWLAAVLALHLAALWFRPLLAVAYGLLLGGVVVLALPGSTKPLSLSALCAAAAAVLFVWPEAFEMTAQPFLLAGMVAAGAAVLLAPGVAVTGVAALGAAAAGYLLAGGGPDLAMPPPDLEANYQVIAVALVAGYVLSVARSMLVSRLRGGAAHV